MAVVAKAVPDSSVTLHILYVEPPQFEGSVTGGHTSAGVYPFDCQVESEQKVTGVLVPLGTEPGWQSCEHHGLEPADVPQF